MRLQISKDLFSYWNELRGDRAAPDRCRIDPCAIRHLLADTFIVEADDACAFPFRLSGSRINALWLREHKGASFVELWRKEDRRELMVALSALVDEASPFVAAATAHAAAGARVEFELLLLPLRNFGETHARVLGALSPVGALNRIGRTPPGPLELVPLRAIEVKKADSERSPMRPIPRNPAGRYPRLVVYNG